MPSDDYYIRDSDNTNGTFLKIDETVSLKDNHLIQIGESFLVVNMLKTRLLPRLRLKLFGGPCTGEVYNFDAYECTTRIVTIGRASDCDVRIEDTLLSKLQASIFFDESKGWVIVDGDLTKHKMSTNGTWLFLNEKYKMTNDMIFKSNQTLFKVNVIV